MKHLPLARLAFFAALCAAAPAVGAQVYKWTDERGVINYSNTPPADSKAKKGVSVVEDRVSVYSADPAVLQATQNARERRGLPPPPAVADSRGAASPPAPRTPAPAVSAADPCASDPLGCGYYDGVPVFAAARRRPPHLVQPQLTPGAIAGNVNAGSGFTPGLSTQAQLGGVPPVVRRQNDQRAPLRDR